MTATGKTLNRDYFADRFVLIVVLLLFQGCSVSNNHAVLAVTGTSIGLEISQNPSTQSPQGKLGYNRSEFAYVPTNRPNTKEILEGAEKLNSGQKPPFKHQGAEESTDVLMELKYAGIFSWGDGGGIYQRLAVGKTAVEQDGAALMFARDAAGNITSSSAQAIQSIKGIPERDPKTKEKVAAISACYSKNIADAAKKKTILDAIKKHYKNLDEFTDAATKHDANKLGAIMQDSQVKGICQFE